MDSLVHSSLPIIQVCAPVFFVIIFIDVKAVILDATFDDVQPLAAARMPKWLSGVVEYAIRNYLNLQIHSIVRFIYIL